jgi:hypothetical protein
LRNTELEHQSIRNLNARKGWVASTKSQPLYLRKTPGTNCTGGWVGLEAALDSTEISPILAQNVLPTALYRPPGRNKRRKIRILQCVLYKIKMKNNIIFVLICKRKATFMTFGRIATFVVQFSHIFQQDRVLLSLGCHVDVCCVLPTLSKTSLSVRHTSARITSEVNNNSNNNNLFSMWIQVFWNVTPCSWMSVPDFSMKTA